MVLGKLPVPGRPTIWITVGQGPIALAVGAGGAAFWTFLLSSILFPFSPSLWETARYRLKYCLKGPLSPKPTNQPTNHRYDMFLAPLTTALTTNKHCQFGHRCPAVINDGNQADGGEPAGRGGGTARRNSGAGTC